MLDALTTKLGLFGKRHHAASRGDIVQQQFLVLCEGLQEINWHNLASHDQGVEDDLESIY